MRFALTLALLPLPAMADTVVAAHTVRAQTVLTALDVGLVSQTVPGALSDLDFAIGMEARVMLYAGRPVRAADLVPPALIQRNQIVVLRYLSGGLSIAVEARALGRAAVGESLRVMNLASRSTVSGRVSETGEVIVGLASYP